MSDTTAFNQAVLTPELTRLMLGSLASASFRDKLLVEAEANVNKAKAALAEAEAVYKQVLELGGQLPRVLRTTRIRSQTHWNKEYGAQLWIETNGWRHWVCECEAYKFSPSGSKHCKHIAGLSLS